jgi:hypothetical protein
MSVTVSLKPRDVRSAKRIAAKRGRPTGGEIPHKAYQSYSGPPSSERHIRGVLGEWAFADYYSVPLDNSDELDDGYDFLVRFNGEPTKFDVKATQYTNGDLRVKVDKVRADYYPLAIVEDLEPEKVDLIGMCTAQVVEDAEIVEGEYSGDQLHAVSANRLEALPESNEIEKFRQGRY